LYSGCAVPVHERGACGCGSLSRFEVCEIIYLDGRAIRVSADGGLWTLEVYRVCLPAEV